MSLLINRVGDHLLRAVPGYVLATVELTWPDGRRSMATINRLAAAEADLADQVQLRSLLVETRMGPPLVDAPASVLTVLTDWLRGWLAEGQA